MSPDICVYTVSNCHVSSEIIFHAQFPPHFKPRLHKLVICWKSCVSEEHSPGMAKKMIPRPSAGALGLGFLRLGVGGNKGLCFTSGGLILHLFAQTATSCHCVGGFCGEQGTSFKTFLILV